MKRKSLSFSQPVSQEADHPGDGCFHYCLEIVRGREFIIRADPDGFIHFYDREDDLSSRPASAESLELDALLNGSRKAAEEMNRRQREYTVTVTIPPECRFDLALAFEKFMAGTWTLDDESDLDEKLIPLFWQHVNPLLRNPLSRL